MNVYVDLDHTEGRKLWNGFVLKAMALQNLRRVVIITAPSCTMHCSLQNSCIQRWKNRLQTGDVTLSRYRAKLKMFANQRKKARGAILYARRLHKYVDANCGQLHAIHIHEQPQKARMARLSQQPGVLSNGIWPTAWDLGHHGKDYADVWSCRVGYTNILGKEYIRMGKIWRFQIRGSSELCHALFLQRCVCKVPHDAADAKNRLSTGFYSRKLASIIVHGARVKT